jgi:hypothetical protein
MGSGSSRPSSKNSSTMSAAIRGFGDCGAADLIVAELEPHRHPVTTVEDEPDVERAHHVSLGDALRLSGGASRDRTREAAPARGEAISQTLGVVVDGHVRCAGDVEVRRKARVGFATAQLHRGAALDDARRKHLPHDRVRDCAGDPLLEASPPRRRGADTVT